MSAFSTITPRKKEFEYMMCTIFTLISSTTREFMGFTPEYASLAAPLSQNSRSFFEEPCIVLLHFATETMLLKIFSDHILILLGQWVFSSAHTHDVNRGRKYFRNIFQRLWPMDIEHPARGRYQYLHANLRDEESQL